MKSYKVNFMDDNEFEKLPYKDVDLALGLADSKTGQAYVRRTGVNALDVYTAMHELEHLEDGKHGEHSDHEYHKDGVYYKIPFLMPILGAVATSLAGAGVNKLLAPKPQQAQTQGQGQPQVMPTQSAALNQFGGSKPNIVAPQAAPMGGSSGMPSTQNTPVGDLLQKRKGNYSGGSTGGMM